LVIMAKRRYGKKKGGSRSKKMPIAVFAPMAVPLIRAYQQTGTYGAKMDRLTRSITGVSIDSGQFNVADALPYWMAQGAGIVVHKVAGKTVNRYIPKWVPVSL